MDQDEGDTSAMPPFWAPHGEIDHRNRRRLRRSYSLLLTSTSFLVLLLVLALFFTIVIVPTLRSFTSHILRPHTVKNSWDSLNLVLVLFAIVCGFLSRNNNAESQTPRSPYRRTFSNPSTPPPPPPWYHYSDPDRSFNRLRSFNSYPDLRQHSSFVAADDRYRFYDDTYLLPRHRQFGADTEEEEKEIEIDRVAAAPPQSLPSPPRTEAVRRNVRRMYQAETIVKRESDDLAAESSQLPPRSLPSPPPPWRTKVVRINVKQTHHVETMEKHETNDLAGEHSQPPSSPPPPCPPPPCPPSPPPQKRTRGVRRNVNQAYQAETIEKHETSDLAAKEEAQPPPSPPPSRPPQQRAKPVRRNAKPTNQAETIEKPEGNNSAERISQPPPPPPPPPPIPAERKTVQGKKKRGIATKEFLTSLRGKKKKQRQRSVENFDSILNSEPLPVTPQQPQSPQSPPPSVFQNLFSSKKGKHKNRHFVSVAATRITNKREHSSSYSRLEDNVMITGNESPLIPIPPPPPPFKLPAWKFRVQGDFVRVDSMGSSRSGSPDLDEVSESVESPATSTQDETNQGNSPFAPYSEDPSTSTVNASSLFCPSPDVDAKAKNFIESFRAGLRMARMNSMKERQGIRRSNLGPSLNSQTINGSRTN